MGNDSKKLLKKILAQVRQHLSDKSDNDLRKLSKASTLKDFRDTLIPEDVAKSQVEEQKKLSISLDNYNEDACIFSSLNGSQLKSFLGKINRVTQFTENQFYTCELNPRPIARSKAGKYSKLFTKLDPGVDKIYEIDIAGFGRFYGLIAGNTYYFVAIDTTHRNTN